LLAHLRWISALAVVLSHVSQDILSKPNYSPQINRFPDKLQMKDIFRPDGFGHAAVVVFFVLSGFLVGGKLIELWHSDNLRLDWWRFFVDRVARIFTVLWPAALFTALILVALIFLAPDAPFVRQGGWAYDLTAPLTSDLSLKKWLGVITVTNELLVPTITVNGPLWSLSYEWSYYMLALAAVLALRSYSSPGALAIIAYGAVLLLLALHNQPDVLFAGISWLAGWVARMAFDRNLMRGWILQALGPLLVVTILIVDHRHPLPDPVLGIALAVMIAHPRWTDFTFAARTGTKLANFSYSLYLTHFPVLLALMAVLNAIGLLPKPLPHTLRSGAIAAAMTLIIILCARCFAWLTEDRTIAVRKFILKRSRTASAVASGSLVDPDKAGT
jgi:peptidoglycan/LPS O-acetylase OafA/YrhL